MIFLNILKNTCYRRMVHSPRPFFIRNVSTSKKKSDVTAVHTETPHIREEKSTSVTKREWRSMGFDDLNEAKDRMWSWSTNFFLVSFLATVLFLFTYYPDMHDHDWFQREAFIELRRREVLGLPLVDPNYVDPATINLPPDEELGDDDIII